MATLVELCMLWVCEEALHSVSINAGSFRVRLVIHSGVYGILVAVMVGNLLTQICCNDVIYASVRNEYHIPLNILNVEMMHIQRSWCSSCISVPLWSIFT